MMIVATTKFGECLVEFGEIAEAAHPEELLLQSAKETFDAAVAFRLAHEGGGRLDAQEFDLVLKVVAHIDAAMVVTQPQAGGAAAGKEPKCSWIA